MAARRSGGGGGGGMRTAASQWQRRRTVAGARSGGRGTKACGSGGDGGWTPFPAFLEQPLERESTPFFLQMTARVCGGGPFPFYRAHNGPRGERAHLRPTTQHLKILIEK